jgi:DNA-binding NarL/FixJ family response regulator
VVLEEYLDSPVTREARVAEGAHLPTDHDRGFNLVDVAGRGYWTFVSYPPRSAPRCFDLQERLAVPIVFISAHDDGPTLERVEKSRAAGHLRDPFDTATVLETIRRAARSIQGR